jgi:hypothetical protein
VQVLPGATGSGSVTVIINAFLSKLRTLAPRGYVRQKRQM